MGDPDDVENEAPPVTAGLAVILRRASSQDMRLPIVSVISTVVALATVVTCLRAYVRRLILRRWGMDDWASMLSYVLVLSTGVLVTLSTRYGRGASLEKIPPENIQTIVRISNAGIVTYQAAVTCLKATFLLQYRRIFPLPTFQFICDIVFWFNLLFGVSQIISIAVRCHPAHLTWTYGSTITKGAACMNIMVWWYINAGINLLTDIVILIMPIPMLHSLPLPKKPKMILIGIFGLGIFTTAINIVRIIFLHYYTVYGAAIAAIFALVEICSGTICVCLPTLRPLLSGTKSPSNSFRPNKRSMPDVEIGSGNNGAAMDAPTDANNAHLPTILTEQEPRQQNQQNQGISGAACEVCGNTDPKRNSIQSSNVEAGDEANTDASMAWKETDGCSEEAYAKNKALPTIAYPSNTSHGTGDSVSTAHTDKSMRSMGLSTLRYSSGSQDHDLEENDT